jgi:DNA-binding cell septation regulator SpoVG
MATQDAKAAGANRGDRAFLVIDWKPFEKNTLKGFVSLTLPSGLTIHNITVHQKGDARWVSMPSRAYKKPDGSETWQPIIEFATKEAQKRFRDATLAALDAYQQEAHE